MAEIKIKMQFYEDKSALRRARVSAVSVIHALRRLKWASEHP